MNKKPENMTTEEIKKQLFVYEKEVKWLEDQINTLKTIEAEMKKHNKLSTE